MSLTSVLKSPRYSELRTKLREVFPRPAIKLQGELLAPPLTKNYSVVGQAFDYLMRFTLEYRYPDKINQNKWVAQYAYNTIVIELEASKEPKIKIGYNRNVVKNRKSFLKEIKNAFALAKDNYKKYISDGVLTDEIILTALFLARLDIKYRVGFIDAYFFNESEEDVKDLRQLIVLANNNQFVVDKKCYLNPDFGIGSSLVQGADVDLILDDTLIDFKATKILAVDREQLNQIICYYILSLIGGINGQKEKNPIKNIALYFARYGVFWQIPISEIADKKNILKFKTWFYKHFQGHLRFEENIKKPKNNSKSALEIELELAKEKTRQAEKELAGLRAKLREKLDKMFMSGKITKVQWKIAINKTQ